MINQLIYTPSPKAITNPDQHRGAMEEASRLIERPRVTPAGIEKLAELREEMDNYVYWAYPDPAVLTKIYFANPILAHHGIGLDYFLSHHHTLWTVATIEELMIARSDATHDYPQGYLPLLPQQASQADTLKRREQLGVVRYSPRPIKEWMQNFPENRFTPEEGA